MLPFLNLNGQLARRISEVHLPRYRFDVPFEKECFEKVVLDFQDAMPFDKKPDLLSHVDFLYMNSVGCVGVLKKWLNKAVTLAVAKDNSTVTIDHLIRSKPSRAACEKMAQEIVEGEQQFKEFNSDTDKRLQDLLGMSKPMIENTAQKPNALSVTPKKRKVPVGNRNPVRDKVGQ